MDTLGTGTYGVVQKTDRGTVKKIASPRYYSTFLRELVILRYLNMGYNSVNYIPTVLNFDVNHGTIEMKQYYKDFQRWLDNDGPDINIRGGIITPLIKSLLYLHVNKIVHADLKPGNIMLDGNSVIIIDFGISGTPKWCLSELTTPAYKDPSQNVSYPVDIYGLGIILSEIMIGETLKSKRGEINNLVKRVDKAYRPLIKSMIQEKYQHRPIAIQIAQKFGVQTPSVINCPVEELYKDNIPSYATDLIDTILIQLNISGPFDSIFIARLGFSVKNDDLRRYYIMAVIFLYGSLYKSNVNISTMTSVCPQGNSYNIRRILLLQCLREIINSDIIIYSLIRHQN
jgi:serine/threonine protein kinase